MRNLQKKPETSPSSVHYGWVIVFVGTLTIVACLGLARFAFGMLLPAMRDALGMSYDQMGLLGTANFAGYLVAVATTPLLLRRLSPRKLISAGLLLIGCCTLGIGISNSYLPVLLLYTLVGCGSGLANIPVMVLVSYWFRSDRRGRAAGLIVAGSGFAIIFSGVAIPLLNVRFGTDGWRAGWLLIALIVLLITLIAALLIRNNPTEKGLEAVGAKEQENYDPAETKGNFSRLRILSHLGGLYFAFGATYVIYGTFIVTTMIEEYNFAEASAGHFWSWVGFFSLFSGTLFGTLSDKIGRKGGLMAVFSVQTLAYLLAGLKLGTIAIFSSVILYGLAAFAIPAIMAAAIGDYLGKARAATGFSLITFGFAIGQTLGPAAAGAVAERTGTFSGSYLSSAALTLLAVILAFFLPSPSTGGKG
ncbi:Sugar phosphate permease [Malonomonas rubra DSM 5091]|uniref:Sugar phosphate permease n=1 Tax=Malonomonas rubra DSM 5091 TaxID=1122189 RepID=A0A1M6HL18_MALRU|nr:MFS transporter [Malonomonas rubra]SHJ22865.1 Sugar phosphate permease [Malonomonas rubra DSM 5091]